MRFNLSGELVVHHVCVDLHAHILGTCGYTEKLDHTAWLGNPPALLRLGIVCLVPPTRVEGGYKIVLFSDPLMPEGIYSLHDGEIDS
ncbi:hypothetical protein L6164_030064 [Bauhinia variegata]|uniref:Uncharacterized protein n=1 Tax=Bauhinia variegata TaxID=167791 RepID=A0ACB9LB37_BAUVA|nr:hypothetical protein L6164_030064 [Bauhinia variegata]